ncbi:hypothetical protein OAM00_04770, partial [Verrucomicrobia bacterium]|nr:hypothetical protein [Verrucomicrobiota bacterium]
MIVALGYETKVRELEGKLLLAEQLISNGHNVFFGSYRCIIQNIKHIKPDCYIADNIDYTKSRLELFELLSKTSTSIYVLENEGALFESFEENYTRYSLKLLKICDQFFTWGELPS